MLIRKSLTDSGGKDGTATSREEADARSIFVGNVNTSLLLFWCYLKIYVLFYPLSNTVMNHLI